MVRFTIGMLILGAAAACAASIDGKWVSHTQVGDADGKTYPMTITYTFKTNGDSLTGTIVQVSDANWMKGRSGQPFEISDGKVDGDKFSFKLKFETTTGEKTAVYQGTVEGDQLKGTIKYRGIGITQPLEASRAK